MGKHTVKVTSNLQERKTFLKHLLNDVAALDIMIEKGLIEKGIARIGAEQEFCIIDQHCRPSVKGPDILSKLSEPHFTTELARYNLEINLDPQELKGRCFHNMETQLRRLLNMADDAASNFNNNVVLTGILPSITKEQVGLDYMTPNPRYYMLGEIIKAIRGADFELNIIGVDELILSHSNILFEACNTSFQLHLQVEPEEFVDMYNWAQMITGPVLSVCTNSPLLFGRQLWSETRIALFQQSIDMRSKGKNLREKQQRVSFGSKWISDITEIYKDDISRYTLLLTTDIEKDSLEILADGGIPKLEALSVHNGTIWKWNRPCYGVGNGKAHLRIENRYIPSGPTVVDEMANMAFWIGLMKGMPEHFRGNWHLHQFEIAKENFYKAATMGIQAGMSWGDKIYPSKELIIKKLIPIAIQGLRSCKVAEADIEKYMIIIKNRAKMNATGSRWMVKSYRNLRKELKRDEAILTLTHCMDKRRKTLKPVHEWPIAEVEESKGFKIHYATIENIMTTDLFTVRKDDLLDLVSSMMKWRNIRHVPVEDDHGKLLGLINKTTIDKYLSSDKVDPLATAGDLMNTNLVVVSPETDIKHAMLKMIHKKVSSLPVVDNGELVGIVTDVDMTLVWEKIEAND
ncbi:MAG: CBS domain-containing protein [Flavobacteriales bacterium]|nr:CBS domain-containing protein [Flavobacteriales bacterium]